MANHIIGISKALVGITGAVFGGIGGLVEYLKSCNVGPEFVSVSVGMHRQGVGENVRWHVSATTCTTAIKKLE